MLARKLGLTITPSSKPKYKLDVFENGNYLASIGDIDYNDFFIYKDLKGDAYAKRRRDLYKIRHAKDINQGRGKLAATLLWDL